MRPVEPWHLRTRWWLPCALVVSFAACHGAPGAPTTGAASNVVPSIPHPEAPPEAVAPGLPEAHVVLEDRRLPGALALELARDHRGAAAAVEAAHAAIAPPGLPIEDECAWQYTLGRLYLAGDDAPKAAAAFDRVSRPPGGTATCTLSTYGDLRAATAYSRAGDFAAAVAHARAVPDDATRADEAHLVLANALADGGDVRAAVPLWQAILARDPKAWIDVACRLSAALLDGAQGAPADHALEALDLVTRVLIEAPKIEVSSGAVALRARALALLPPKVAKARSALTPAQRERRARAWLDGGDAKKAVAEADGLLASLEKEAMTPTACAVATTRAQATARAKLPGVPEAWANAIERCAHDDARVLALYQGAKATLTQDPQLAMGRFREVEKQFPKHRLADDARFQGALLALGQHDEARFTEMMSSLPSDYPDGDMGGEGLFRLALLRMTKGEWATAGEALDRITSLFPGDRHWATAGRAAYFRARVASALGQREDAMQRYARIVEDQPLTFYMTQAYDRLASLDPVRAKQTLDAAIAREPQGPLLTKPYAELSSRSFQLGVRLLETGDVEAAKTEIAASGAVRDEAESELLWAVALLYDTAGAPEVGHAFARSRLTDHLAHYPAGRWRTPWQVAYPRAFSSLVLADSQAHAIPPSLTWAIMREESDFNADAKSASNAYGLMQIIASTARGLAVGTPYGADEVELKRPDASIALGTKYLGGLRAEFPLNRPLAIAAYNAGAGSVTRWLAARGDQDFDLWVEQIPFDETRGYIKRVLASEAAYGLLYDRAAFDEVCRISRRASGVARAAGAGATL